MRTIPKLFLAAMLAAATAISSLTLPASALTAEIQKGDSKIDFLVGQNLLRGTGNGLELESGATRAQAITLLCRILGKEEEALAGSWQHPFTDAPDWADAYIGWAWENGVTRGVSDTLFGSDEPIEANTFLTMVLRAMGYQDNRSWYGIRFDWDSPYALADRLALLDSVLLTDVRTRDTLLETTPEGGTILHMLNTWHTWESETLTDPENGDRHPILAQLTRRDMAVICCNALAGLHLDGSTMAERAGFSSDSLLFRQQDLDIGRLTVERLTLPTAKERLEAGAANYSYKGEMGNSSQPTLDITSVSPLTLNVDGEMLNADAWMFTTAFDMNYWMAVAKYEAAYVPLLDTLDMLGIEWEKTESGIAITRSSGEIRPSSTEFSGELPEEPELWLIAGQYSMMTLDYDKEPQSANRLAASMITVDGEAFPQTVRRPLDGLLATKNGYKEFFVKEVFFCADGKLYVMLDALAEALGMETDGVSSLISKNP